MTVNIEGVDLGAPVSAQERVGKAQTIELLEEVLQIAKRTVETGRVRVSISTETEQKTVNETLQSRRVSVDRVLVGRQLAVGEAAPQSRTEGDVLIVPMVEEVLVVEKRLVVTEELHIRIVREEQSIEHTLPLRRQIATVEHLPPGDQVTS